MQNVTLHAAAVDTFIGAMRVPTDFGRVIVDLDDNRCAILLDIASGNRDQGRFRHRRVGRRICNNLSHASVETLPLE